MYERIDRGRDVKERPEKMQEILAASRQGLPINILLMIRGYYSPLLRYSFQSVPSMVSSLISQS